MHDDHTDEREFKSLLGRLLDGGLPPVERGRLGALIANDTERRKKYLDYCQLHARLRHQPESFPDIEQRMPVEGVVVTSVAADNRPIVRRARWLSAIAGWGAIAVAATIALWLSWRRPIDDAIRLEPQNAERHLPTERGTVVAQVSQVAGARFAAGTASQQIPASGTALRAGAYRLESGLVGIEYATGASVLIQAPAYFKLVDAKTIELLEGRMTAHVTADAVGFTVTTPSAEIVDYGTAFGVDVQSGMTSEVHVFEGEVEVKPHSLAEAAIDPVRLTTGQASRVDFNTGIPAGIDLAEQKFLRTISAPETAYRRCIEELKPAVYYPMEPAEDGLSILDASGNAAHGSVVPGYSTESVWAKGKVGAAFLLGRPAVKRYGVVPRYPQTESDRVSVVAWVWANSRPRWASIAKNWGHLEHGQFHFGLHHDAGMLEVHIHEDSGAEICVKDQVPLPLNQWHHVAFVADGEYLRLYRNGGEIGAAAYRGLNRHPLLKALGIGVKLTAEADRPAARADECFWDGRLDELAVFNHALTARQICELYELCPE